MSNEVRKTVSTDKLFSMLKTSGKSYDLEKIQKAYEYADKLHEGQFRNSGDPYISHPIAVAEIVASLGLDTDSICAAFLHDTVEDCPDKTNLVILRNLFVKIQPHRHCAAFAKWPIFPNQPYLL